MRLLVVGDLGWHNGSSHVVREYVRHAADAGVEIRVSSQFGKRDEVIAGLLPFCDDATWATHALVVYEGFPYLSGEDVERLDAAVPRDRRAVVDADGHWGDRVAVGDDDNTWPCGREEWRDHLRAAGEIVLQPALGRPPDGATEFPYFGLPARRRAAVWPRRKLHVQYVGSNWFRADQVLGLMSAARAGLGDEARLRVCGTYWDGSHMDGFESATSVDPGRLADIGVEVLPPVPFGQVIGRMGDAMLTPVLVRPVLGALGLLTPRMLETLAADTIPVYRPEDEHIAELYGDERLAVATPDDVARAVRDRNRLAKSARGIHRRLSEHFSYPVLLRRLRSLLTV